MGCGPLAALIIIAIILLSVIANEAVGFFATCDEDGFFDCVLGVMEEEEEAEEGSVTAVGTYEWKGYPITVTMNIPLAGGAVTGSVSGTCEGNVKGNFNGSNNGAISGNLSGVCSPFFVNIPSGATFSGSVNKSGKAVPISFSGHGGGLTHDGSMTLAYP